MPKNEHEPIGVRVHILKDMLPDVTIDQATALVGLLFENQIVLAVETWNPSSQTKQRRVIELQPLDPQAASVLVADAFEFDCDQLVLRFQQDWVTLKRSVIAKELKAAIQSHKSVDRIEPFLPSV
jgi:hypothetical protein